jgi:CrcB protein
MRTIWVGVAGFFGAISRYGVGAWMARAERGQFPLHTLVINLTGSLVLGVLFALFASRFTHSETLRLALTVGFLGAYTTFSTFSLETWGLIDEGLFARAAAYVGASVAGGVAAVYLGERIGRAL